MAAPQRQPAAALKEARERKFREWFEGRRWRVMTEATGERELTGDDLPVPIVITFNQGRFKIPPPAKFHTPFGHGGRQGILIMELDENGQDTGTIAAFGVTALAKAQQIYGLIVGLDGE